MEAIFHEKQEGSLCAQHCLNALLQGPYFTPVDLGLLAQKMDDEERLCMAECGEESEEYQRFLQQPSGNMDDSGYFSVQVISSALEVWGLELVPYTSAEERAREAFNTPCAMKAYICHYKDHWFTIRQLGNQWFNLNSLLSKPELISDTYLSLFLAQLIQEGYSIFVVFGELPECEADELLRVTPAVRAPRPRIVPVEVEADLEKAIQLSLSETSTTASTSKQESKPTSTEDEHELQKALQLTMAMSLECKSNTPSAPSTPCSSDFEEIRRKRIAFLERTAAMNGERGPTKSDVS
ncbi:hypothetical protein CBL_03476 [Carabus blaptoides fortunei]